MDLHKYYSNAGGKVDGRLLANTIVVHKNFSYACVVARLLTIMSVSSWDRGRLWQVFVHALIVIKLLAEKNNDCNFRG